MIVKRPGPGTCVTVVGLARSGLSAARFLLELGCRVRVTELARSPDLEAAAKELLSRGAAVELGGHSVSFLEESDLIVASPGVPRQALPLRWAGRQGVPVAGELELGSWYASGRLIAVTGTNGKSTVVTLLGEILKAAGKEAVVCGNIGQPLCGVLSQVRPSTLVVMEVSSFQLEISLSFNPEIACVLNVTANHLDRHRRMSDYRAAKGRIFSHQSGRGWGVLNADDPGSLRLLRRVKGSWAAFSRRRETTGAYFKEGWLRLSLPSGSARILPQEALFKRGAHDEENALAAAAIGGLLEVPPEPMAGVLRTFEGLAHRQQEVGTVRGVLFVNDSKSTTVAAGLKAIEAASRPVVLIAGGRDKGSDFAPLRALRRRIKGAVVIGEDGPKIASALPRAVSCKAAGSLREAVRFAFTMARPGECVLLSPMCASFDMFRDFEDRGAQFEKAVRELE
ncbi:MAG: UDP-N-acetylmuramoyl-L-alanine--D-glutamate ligase [Candidatus Omnitrophica bacterium]|nr:UDP-N-acetylmuramoyl-L-alanine--D-glutamate ligase [Candidatus Omnitrophota bacterium]